MVSYNKYKEYALHIVREYIKKEKKQDRRPPKYLVQFKDQQNITVVDCEYILRQINNKTKWHIRRKFDDKHGMDPNNKYLSKDRSNKYTSKLKQTKKHKRSKHVSSSGSSKSDSQKLMLNSKTKKLMTISQKIMYKIVEDYKKQNKKSKSIKPNRIQLPSWYNKPPKIPSYMKKPMKIPSYFTKYNYIPYQVSHNHRNNSDPDSKSHKKKNNEWKNLKGFFNENGYDHRLNTIPGDGDCFFTSIANIANAHDDMVPLRDGLNLGGDAGQFNQQDIRGYIAGRQTYMYMNGQITNLRMLYDDITNKDFDSLIPLHNDDEWADELVRLTQGDRWGINSDLVLFNEDLNKKLCVIIFSDDMIIYPNNFEQTTKYVGFIYYNGKNHYQTLDIKKDTDDDFTSVMRCSDLPKFLVNYIRKLGYTFKCLS
jgi:hypothetical protein